MTMQLDQRIIDTILRTQFAAFIEKAFATVSPGQLFRPNWHIETIAWHLEQVAKGSIKRLIISLPPRYLKSICASVAFPAWVLGQDPGRRIICVSYSDGLSRKHALDNRALMQSDWYLIRRHADRPWRRPHHHRRPAQAG
jgi:hypothetical protein